MKNKIYNHMGLKILSFVIAFIIWIVVANVDDYKTTKQITGIEIQFINGDAITEKNKVYEVPDGTTVDIVVKGRRRIVEELTGDDFKAVADLSKMSITDAVAVEVSAISSHVGKDLTISYTENAITVAVEDKIQKQLPITVRANGDVAEGYAIRNKTATPNLITVEGAESVVNMIEEVVVNVDVANASHSLTSYAEPVFLDKNGEMIDFTKFDYDVESVAVSVEILQTKELSVKVKTIGRPKEGYAIANVDYQPTSIVVVGENADLAKVDELLIDDVDVTDCSKDLETSVTITDYLPEGITLADTSEEVMIKVIVEKIEEKILLVDADEINIVGKNKEYSYTYKNGTGYSLVVRGLKEKLDDLKVTNMIPSIDVTGYGPGVYTFTVNLKEIKGIEVDGELTVELEITQAE
ncbi:MAG: CdaR family protein [Bacteroidales bacterium]|nr:CdaR family protein [Clostridium sp.]MCM1204997.1 CdaR family protein [Bacteroidales bacterium]